MFDFFKASDGSSEDHGLTTLDLHTAPRLAGPPLPKVEAQPTRAQPCVQVVMGLEGVHGHFVGAHLKFEELVRVGLKPEVLFYLAFPQQGHSFSITTPDGSKTILPIFSNKPMADAYSAARKLGAVTAACRLDHLGRQADRWIASGINYYSLNNCCRCTGMYILPIVELQTEDVFLSKWRLDLANRRQFAESYGRNASNAFGSNPKQARIWLEGIRDHVDPANPYLHWTIAILAGISGDLQANAASIERLEAFGPAFAGKLQGTSFHPTEPGSQMRTLAEAMLGLGISLGYIDPSKLNKQADAS